MFTLRCECALVRVFMTYCAVEKEDPNTYTMHTCLQTVAEEPQQTDVSLAARNLQMYKLYDDIIGCIIGN